MQASLRFYLAPLLAAVMVIIFSALLLHNNRLSAMQQQQQHLSNRLDVVMDLLERQQQQHLNLIHGISEVLVLDHWAQYRVHPERFAVAPLPPKPLKNIYSRLGYQGYLLVNDQFELLDLSIAHDQRAPQAWQPSPEVRQVLQQTQQQGQALSAPLIASGAMLHTPLSHLPVEDGSLIQLVCNRIKLAPETISFCLYFSVQQEQNNLLAHLDVSFHGEILAFGSALDATDTPSALRPDWSWLKQGQQQYQEGFFNAQGQAMSGLLRWHPRLNIALLAQEPLQLAYGAYYSTVKITLWLISMVLILLLGLTLLAQRNRQQLAQREALYRQILDNLPLQVRIRDLQGQALLENRMAREGEMAHVAHLPLQATQPDSRLPALAQNIWQTQRATLHSGMLEAHEFSRGNFQDQSFKAYQIMAFPIRDHQQALLALGSLVVDETPLIRSRESLQALTINLETQVQQRTQELALARDAAESAARTKANFLANMSHEIRSPLNAVLGLSHLAKRANNDPRVQGYLQRIQKSAEHLQEVVNGILDYSKIEAGKLQLERIVFSPETLLEGVADILWEKAQQKNLALVFDIDPKLPSELYGDPLRLSQILLNLTDNAIKFTREGLVALRVLVSAHHDSQWQLRFEVQDSGPGLSEDELEHIFQPFEQLDESTSRQHGGTGLGLPISQQLAHLMGGKLEVASVPGQGSLFTLRLSLDSHAPEQPNLDACQSRRALLVDSQPHSRHNLSHMLQALGLQVTPTESPRQALAELRQAKAQHTPFALVFIDWDIEGGSSVLAEQLHRAQLVSQSHLVMLYTHGCAGQLPDTLLQHFAAVLDKPVTPQRMRETVLRLQPLEPQTRLSGRHVLLVENEPLSQEISRELLESLQIKVSQACNGVQALHYLSYDPSIELVLMDVQMPLLDGHQTTRQLRQSHPHLPVIAMTGNSLPGDRERCLDSGMNDYLSKPIHPSALEKMLCHWLSQEPAQCLSICGLNEQQALGRLLNNRELYQRLLQRFVEGYADIDHKIRLALSQDHSAGALDMLHNFKSLAATLGAEHLQQLSQDLEQALRSADYEAALQAFSQELQRLVEAIAARFMITAHPH